MFQWDDFGQYLWASMRRLAKTGNITMMDLPKFVKTFCRILTYRKSLRSFFENRDNMYQMLHPDDSLSDAKFRAMLQSLRPRRNSSDRKALDAFLSNMTRPVCLGKYFWMLRTGHIVQTTTSMKPAPRRALLTEGFFRKRHSVGGGYGSVIHMTVSALSDFITGGVMNSVTENDVKSLKEMYTSMTGSRGEELNLDNMRQEFDRGYKKESFLSELDDWNGLHRGTHPRTPCLLSFLSFTFGHPKNPRNIDEHGPAQYPGISRFSERGTKGLNGYMSAMTPCLLSFPFTFGHPKNPKNPKKGYKRFEMNCIAAHILGRRVFLASPSHLVTLRTPEILMNMAPASTRVSHASVEKLPPTMVSSTVHSVEDTIVDGSFSTSDDDDTDYEPEISVRIHYRRRQ
jgi:hypothetical protein